jgi:hypothetical protein
MSMPNGLIAGNIACAKSKQKKAEKAFISIGDENL